MTKKERAEFDSALAEARLLGALRFTSKVERDVMPPKSGYAAGFDINPYGDGSVWEAWTSSVTHGRGGAPISDQYSSGSQNCRSLYSTKELAWRAVRNAMERAMAARLAGVDHHIQEAIK